MKKSHGILRGEGVGFYRCAELVLPWLSPADLASISTTCKRLHRAAQSITTHRSSDASRSLERHPIPFFSDPASPPYSYFFYSPFSISALSSPSLSQPWPTPRRPTSPSWPPPWSDLGPVFGSGCGCSACPPTTGGETGCPCSTLSPSFSDVGTECGANCACGIDCPNRATQRGVAVRLKIVRTAAKGWGLFAHEPVSGGDFICEYAGELLATEEARKRQHEYDQLVSQGGFSSALLVVREHLPSGKACLRINIDATRVANVARFINHACDGGNLSTTLDFRSFGVKRMVKQVGKLLPLNESSTHEESDISRLL